MQADWEVEIGADAPVIDACWPGFVDLRQSPQLAWSLPEACALPPLGDALIRVNGSGSAFWTAKCDFWPELEAEAFDLLELDAPTADSAHAAGCYIDLLPRVPGDWASIEGAVLACRGLCALLHDRALRSARVDLMIRRALLADEQGALGATAYLTACGRSPMEATRVLAEALAMFVDTICADSTLK